MKSAQQPAQQWKPFMSVVVIIATLFGIVFFKMEERRLGYESLQMARFEKAVIEEKRSKQIDFVRLTRPQHIKSIAAARLTLNRPKANQIIHLTGDAWTVGVR